MLARLIIRLYGTIPPVRGRAFFAEKVIAPLVRGKGYEVEVTTNNPGGGKLICNLDDWIPWNVFLFGRYEIEKRYEEFMMRFARTSKVIFDIGANIGYYSIQFERILENGTVYSFEPMSYQFGVLKRNILLNGLGNVIANKTIISDTPNAIKRIYFSGMSNTGSSSLEIGASDYEDVICTTVDDYCEVNNIGIIDLIKIDVEGHELCVLTGMEKMLNKGRVRSLFCRN